MSNPEEPQVGNNDPQVHDNSNDSSQTMTLSKSFIAQASTHANLSKQEKIDLILQLRAKIDGLISNIRDSKTLCDKYDSEIQYFQEYIGGLVKK